MRKLLSFCVFVAACLSFGLRADAAHAESYQLFNLGGDDVALIGINASGSVLMHQFTGCNGTGDPNFCFEEFSAGNLVYRADAAPADFVAQNGTACAPPAGLSLAGKSICDGSYQVAGGRVGNQLGVWESYPGSPLPGDFIYFGTADVLYLNAAGDFLVADGMHDSVYQVVVATAPEPSSLFLLATGALGLGGIVRRRLSASEAM